MTLIGFERTPAYRLRLWVVIGFADSGVRIVIGFVDTARAGVHWLRAIVAMSAPIRYKQGAGSFMHWPPAGGPEAMRERPHCAMLSLLG